MDQTLTLRGSPRPLSALLEARRRGLWNPASALCSGSQRRCALSRERSNPSGLGADVVVVNERLQPHLAPGPQSRRFGGNEADPEFCPPELAGGGGRGTARGDRSGRAPPARSWMLHGSAPRGCLSIGGPSVPPARGRIGSSLHVSPDGQGAIPVTRDRSWIGRWGSTRSSDSEVAMNCWRHWRRSWGRPSPPDSPARSTPPRGSLPTPVADTPAEGHRLPSSPSEAQAGNVLSFQRLGRIASSAGSAAAGWAKSTGVTTSRWTAPWRSRSFRRNWQNTRISFSVFERRRRPRLRLPIPT